MDAVIHKIYFLAIIIALGFLAEKTGLAKGLKAASSLILTRITLPLLVITTLSGTAATPQTRGNAAAVFIFGIVFIVMMLFIGKGVSSLLRFPQKRADVYTCLTAFGNSIFLGYPLLQAMWGDQAVFYAAFFSIANDLSAWTLGILILSRNKNGKPDFRQLLNPTTLSYVIGALMFLFSLRLPPLLHETAFAVGNTTTALSMLCLGAILADVPFREMLSGLSALSIVLLKMILLPLGAFYAMRFLIPALELPVDMFIIYVLAIELAMPSPSVFAIVAHQCGSDTDYAATTICLTTAASLITIPFLFSLIH